MLPRSPPDPFTHSTCFTNPSTGSTCSSFELVFPPPKLVIRRSLPSKFEPVTQQLRPIELARYRVVPLVCKKPESATPACPAIGVHS